MITVDNGREFDNEEVKNWTQENNIILDYSIPHYHASNGRIERVNRTIREACKKTPGLTEIKLAKILKNYNECRHRAI